MGLGPNGVEVAMILITNSCGQNVPECAWVVIDGGVMIRRSGPSNKGGWASSAQSLVSKIKCFTKNLSGVKVLVFVGDLYDQADDYPHRVYVGQQRKKKVKPCPQGLVINDFLNLQHARVPSPTEFDYLANQRDWRQEVFVPLLARHFGHFLSLPGSDAFQDPGVSDEVVVVTRGLTAATSLLLPPSSSSTAMVQSGGSTAAATTSSGEKCYVHLVSQRKGADGSGTVYTPSPEYIQIFNTKSAEADTGGASALYAALLKGQDAHLVTGDGDLLLTCLMMADWFARNMTEEELAQQHVPAFYLTIDSRLGSFDVWGAGREVQSKMTTLIQRFDHSVNVGPHLEDQMIAIACVIMCLGEVDTATIIPYIKAGTILTSLSDYFMARGKPPTRFPTEQNEFLEDAVRRHYDTLIYRNDQGVPFLHYAAWYCLIAHAAQNTLNSKKGETKQTFQWHHRLTFAPEPMVLKATAPTCLSLGYITAHLARAEWTLKYMTLEPHIHNPNSPRVPNFLPSDASSGFMKLSDSPDGEIVAVKELNPKIFIRRDARALGYYPTS